MEKAKGEGEKAVCNVCKRKWVRGGVEYRGESGDNVYVKERNEGEGAMWDAFGWRIRGTPLMMEHATNHWNRGSLRLC